MGVPTLAPLFFNAERKASDSFFEVLEVSLLFCRDSSDLFAVLVAGKLFHPSPSFPALQFLDSLEKNSSAEKAGLQQNDYVLEVSLFLSRWSCSPRKGFDLDQRNECDLLAPRGMCSIDQTLRRDVSVESDLCSSLSPRAIGQLFSLSSLSTQRFASQSFFELVEAHSDVF